MKVMSWFNGLACGLMSHQNAPGMNDSQLTRGTQIFFIISYQFINGLQLTYLHYINILELVQTLFIYKVLTASVA
ncbi:Uncharacterised protein [Enterobacter kobei]|nr:Uncharacterised protein [Enterobacter kobei]